MIYINIALRDKNSKNGYFCITNEFYINISSAQVINKSNIVLDIKNVTEKCIETNDLGAIPNKIVKIIKKLQATLSGLEPFCSNKITTYSSKEHFIYVMENQLSNSMFYASSLNVMDEYYFGIIKNDHKNTILVGKDIKVYKSSDIGFYRWFQTNQINKFMYNILYCKNMNSRNKLETLVFHNDDQNMNTIDEQTKYSDMVTFKDFPYTITCYDYDEHSILRVFDNVNNVFYLTDNEETRIQQYLNCMLISSYYHETGPAIPYIIDGSLPNKLSPLMCYGYNQNNTDVVIVPIENSGHIYLCRTNEIATLIHLLCS